MQAGLSFKNWVYPAYAKAMRPRRKLRKRRPSERGQLILTGVLLTAALGLNTDTSYVYQIFALLMCLAIASRLTLRIAKPNIDVKRILPRYATAGQPFTYRIRLTNLGSEPEYDLVINDVPEVNNPSRLQFLSEKEPFEDSRNAYDRFIGFHRFMYLQRKNTGMNVKPARADEIPIKGFTEIEIEANPLRRGMINFQRTTVMHQDPLALNYGLNHFQNPESLLVLPRRYQINPAWKMSGGRNFQPGGITAAWSIGESDEFVSLRDYRDGDSLRKIHWPSTAKSAARFQKPVVKEYQDEFFARNALILDLSHVDTDIIEETINVAASLVLELQSSDAMLDLLFLNDDGPRMITTERGTSAVNEQLEALATIKRSDAPITNIEDAALNHSRLITGCFNVFSNWSDDHLKLVKKIAAKGVNQRNLVISNNDIGEGPFVQLNTASIQEDLLRA